VTAASARPGPRPDRPKIAAKVIQPRRGSVAPPQTSNAGATATSKRFSGQILWTLGPIWQGFLR